MSANCLGCHGDISRLPIIRDGDPRPVRYRVVVEGGVVCSDCIRDSREALVAMIAGPNRRP